MYVWIIFCEDIRESRSLCVCIYIFLCNCFLGRFFFTVLLNMNNFQTELLTHRWDSQVLLLFVRVDLEPHRQMQFSIISRTPFYFWKSYLSAGDRVSVFYVSPVDRVGQSNSFTILLNCDWFFNNFSYHVTCLPIPETKSAPGDSILFYAFKFNVRAPSSKFITDFLNCWFI